MPADAGNEPLQVLTEIRDLLADIFGLAEHQAVQKDRVAAEAELRQAGGEERREDEAAEEAGDRKDRERPRAAERPARTPGSADPHEEAERQREESRGHHAAAIRRLFRLDEDDSGQTDGMDSAAGLLGTAGGPFGELAGLIRSLKEGIDHFHDLAGTPEAGTEPTGPPAPATPGERQTPARKKAEDKEPDKLDATTGLLGVIGGPLAELANLIRSMDKGLGHLFDLLGLRGKEQEKPVLPDLPARPDANLLPALPEGAFRTSPTQDRPVAVDAAGLPRPEPPVPATPPLAANAPERRPVPELPSPLADPRPEAQPLPELPSPLAPEPRPTPAPEKPARGSPEWLRELLGRTAPTTGGNPQAVLTPGGERRDRSGEAEWREARSRPGPLPPVPQPPPAVPPPVPVPGNGVPLPAGREDGDVVFNQTAPVLTPATPAPPGGVQGNQDQARLALALERILALLQRQAGVGGQDRDGDETESGENWSSRPHLPGAEPASQDQRRPRSQDVPGLGNIFDRLTPQPEAPGAAETRPQPNNNDGGFFTAIGRWGDWFTGS